MTLENKFFNILTHVHEKQETGKVYAYSRSRDGGEIHVGLLFFKKGNPCGFLFDKIAGIDALKRIANSVIASTMFVPTSPKQLVEQDAVPGYDEIFNALRRVAGAREDAKQKSEAAKLSGAELVHVTAVTLGDILGSKVREKVESLGQVYRPETSMQRFVDECFKLATNYLGKRRAEEILEQIFH